MRSHSCGIAAVLFMANFAYSQGTLADYQRAQGLQRQTRGLVVDIPSPINWIGETDHFWYSKTMNSGTTFVLVDARAGVKKQAFDHERLAAAISSSSGKKYTARELPFAPPQGGGRGAAAATFGARTAGLTFMDNQKAIQFGADGFLWKCTLTEYSCTKGSSIAQAAGTGGGAPEDSLLSAPYVEGGDPIDGLEYNPFPQQGAGGFAGQRRDQPPCAPRGPGADGTGGRMSRGQAAPAPGTPPAGCASFDGKWEAIIQNFNVFLRATGSNEPPTPLSQDGSEGNYYTLRSVAWSPDSKKLAAYHTKPGYDRQVHYVESSPADQLQPKHTTNSYRKPGDALDISYPVLYDIASRKAAEIDPALWPNAFSLSSPVWRKDSRAFTFEYNPRGHQGYKVIEVDSQSGKTRPLIDEQSKTFFYYNLLGPGFSGGRRFRQDINDGKEIVWASERDGWEHLYLYDGTTGRVKNQITMGNWVVRNVIRVDEQARQIWFEAGGMNPKQDPYFTQCYRINFDGSGLIALTEADGNHTVSFSHDNQYYVDTWSRVDLPTEAQLRRAADGKVVMNLEKADSSALLSAGLHYPEVFVAKGRDGQTDIWGAIVRPMNFDPNKKYPVIEQIYAGPQGSFVPKNFSAVSQTQALAELGFIVVQIDGMGTSNRSKAFHDVAFKNLGDAGFPDRILWHKAVAAKYPSYDISRVGIYGTSAGGQNSLGGVLFHPDFYKVAVTNSGCHDNRMDKIWWNEQWMSWPLGPQYRASSNVDNAYRLQGKALIIIPEMDTNVDPSSSLQVVNALVKAKKHFDMLYIPGQNHGTGVLAQQHYLQDYFVRHLLGVEPPDWNRISLPDEPTPSEN